MAAKVVETGKMKAKKKPVEQKSFLLPSHPLGATSTGANQIMITPDEWQELRTARSAALQANPDLIVENKKLMDRMRALEDKLDAIMIKSNPTIAPIIAKFEANRPHPGMPAGSPPAK